VNFLFNSCPYTVNGEHEPNVILKDNDIKYKIRLSKPTTESLLLQLRSDVDYLFSIGVMDYSLLGNRSFESLLRKSLIILFLF
jgi:hypothetical protein